MNTIRTLLALGAASLAFSQIASANIGLYRAADDQLFAISAEARSLRWDVATAPIRECDRRVWLRGMDDICDEIADLHKSLFRGRSPQHLCREVEDLREEICELRDDLNRLGSPTSFRYERGLSGSRFRCGVYSGGCVLPTNFIARLDNLDQQALALHNLISGGGLSSIGHPGFGQPAFGQPSFGQPMLDQLQQHDLFRRQPQLTVPPATVPQVPGLPAPSLTPRAIPLPPPAVSQSRRSRTDTALSTVQWILSQLD